MPRWEDRGDGRKVHYGAGKQPIDTWIELGWAPYAYAANVVKYLRRTKEPEHSLESAQVCYRMLREAISPDDPIPGKVFAQLLAELTEEEYQKVRGF